MTQKNPFADAFKSFSAQAPQLNDAIEAGQRNLEKFTTSFTTANQVIVESMQKIAQRQFDAAQSQTEEAFNLFKEIAVSKDPKASMSKQVDFAKKSFEKATADAREVSELASQSGKKVFDLYGEQFSNNVQEFKKAAKAAKAAKASASPASKATKKAA